MRFVSSMLTIGVLLCGMVACAEDEDVKQAFVDRLTDVSARCDQYAMCLDSSNKRLVAQLPETCPTLPVANELVQQALEEMNESELRDCVDALAAEDACVLALDCNGYGIFRGADNHCGDSEDEACCQTLEGEDQACPPFFGSCFNEVVICLVSCFLATDHAVADSYNTAMGRRL